MSTNPYRTPKIETPKTLVVDVRHCARCGDDHKDLEFYALDNPADEFKYYGICPNNAQPILLARVQEIR